MSKMLKWGVIGLVGYGIFGDLSQIHPGVILMVCVGLLIAGLVAAKIDSTKGGTLLYGLMIFVVIIIGWYGVSHIKIGDSKLPIYNTNHGPAPTEPVAPWPNKHSWGVSMEDYNNMEPWDEQ